MHKFFSRLLPALLLFNILTAQAGVESERTLKKVTFAKGASSAKIKGSIKGSHYIDYQLNGGAGQVLSISLKRTNLANYFNLLPPESSGDAMVIGEFSNNHFEGMLPDDGIYTVRVYLMRSAARRNEASNFTLSIGISGKPLIALPSKVDAPLPGTRYHASTSVKCEPAFTKTRNCEALVIRRGFDGTATIELRWDKNLKRRILFIKGEPKVADVQQAMRFTRNENGWLVMFNDDERFEIPEPLVFGG